MRHRSVRILLPFIVMAGLASCAGGSGDGGGKAECPKGRIPASGEPTPVTFWHAMSAQNEVALKDLVAAYNSSQRRVRVDLSFQGSYDETLDKYMAVARTGDAPDLVQLDSRATQLMIDSGSALPVQACVDAEGYDLSDYIPRVVDYLKVDGRLWSMPWNASDPVLYYNKKAFEKAGLDPNRPPATLAELRDASERIVASGAARHGVALDLSATYFIQWFGAAGKEFVDHQNGRAGRAGKVLFDEPLGVALLGTLKSMVDQGLALNVGRNPGGTQTFLAVASKDAAMTLGSSASLGSILATLAAGQVRDVEVGVGALPVMPGNGGVSLGGGALWMSARSAPERQEAAWDFLKWLDQPEQQARLHLATGYIPIRKSAVRLPAVADAWAAKPEFRVGYDQLLAGVDNAASAGPVLGPVRQVADAIVQAMETILLQGAEPAAALRTAATASNTELAEYNRRVGG